MSFSLLSADRNTHFKIVAVALIAVLVLAIIGLNARTPDSELVAGRTEANGPVVKAGKPISYSSADGPTNR